MPSRSCSGRGTGASRNVRGRVGRALRVERVEVGGVAVADDHPRRPVRGRLQAHPPVHGVGAEEGEVGAGVAGREDVVAHGGGPVLVVAHRDVAPGSVERARRRVQVDVGEVGQRLAGPLGAHDDRDRRRAVVVGAGRPVVGAVEAHGVAAPVAGRPVVEAVAAPRVVGLPGRDGRDERDGARARRARSRRTAPGSASRSGCAAGRRRTRAATPSCPRSGPASTAPRRCGSPPARARAGLPAPEAEPGLPHERAGAAPVGADPVGRGLVAALGGRDLEPDPGAGHARSRGSCRPPPRGQRRPA